MRVILRVLVSKLSVPVYEGPIAAIVGATPLIVLTSVRPSVSTATPTAAAGCCVRRIL